MLFRKLNLEDELNRVIFQLTNSDFVIPRFLLDITGLIRFILT